MSDAPTVNLEEMADKLRVSLPTMRRLVKRYDDFPVVARGSNGVPWQFDPAAVIAFVQAKRAEEAAGRAERDSLLAQISLPIEELVPPEERGATADERLKIARAMKAEDELARDRGFLVLTTEMRPRLTEVWVSWTQFLGALPATLGRRHNLPDAVVRDMRALIAEQQRQTVQRLRDLLAPHIRASAEEEGEGDAAEA